MVGAHLAVSSFKYFFAPYFEPWKKNESESQFQMYWIENHKQKQEIIGVTKWDPFIIG